MRWYIRIYYLVCFRNTLARFKERFRTTVSVNYESKIYTDDEGKALLEESERKGFIKIREVRKL